MDKLVFVTGFGEDIEEGEETKVIEEYEIEYKRVSGDFDIGSGNNINFIGMWEQSVNTNGVSPTVLSLGQDPQKR